MQTKVVFGLPKLFKKEDFKNIIGLKIKYDEKEIGEITNVEKTITGMRAIAKVDKSFSSLISFDPKIVISLGGK